MSDQQAAKFPATLSYPTGHTIDTEELIKQLSLLRRVLQIQLDRFGQEPLSYPEASALYDIASSAYLALAGTFYADEIKSTPNFV